MENLTGSTPPVRPLPCVVPCKLYFENVAIIILGIAIVYFLWLIKAIPKNYSDSTVKEFLTVEEQQQIRKGVTVLSVAVVCLPIVPLLLTLLA